MGNNPPLERSGYLSHEKPRTGDVRGAASAVFAARSSFSEPALRTMKRSARPHRWSTLLSAVFAGSTMFGLYGAGGVDVDVRARAMTFGAGLLHGFAFSHRKPEKS